MKKKEWILIGLVLIIATGLLLVSRITHKVDGERVIVSVDGEEYATLDLNQDRVFEIKGDHGGINILEIKDGVVKMIEADCPDKLCIHQNPIKMNHEMIVCLPNKVLVEVKGNNEKKVDSLVN